MTNLRDREVGFEAKFGHDDRKAFKVRTRRNKLLGLWAADLLGLTGADADAYARSVVASQVGSGDVEVHDKVFKDLHDHGADLSDHRLQRTMAELLAVAEADVEADPNYEIEEKVL